MSNVKAAMTSLVVPLVLPSIVDADTIAAACQSTDTIDTLAKAYPEITLKIKRILRKWGNPSISNKGICEASIIVPSSHISEVILSPISDMDKSIGDPRIELDYHINAVFLWSDPLHLSQLEKLSTLNHSTVIS